MKNNSEALDMFRIFVIKIENQFNIKIKRFHGDRGAQHNSHMFNDFYKLHGIKHETIAPCSSEMNGNTKKRI